MGKCKKNRYIFRATSLKSHFDAFQDPFSGIIPRTLSHLFDELRIQEVECTVRVSFIEIYNEDIYDLLSGTDDTTKLRQVFFKKLLFDLI